MKKTLIVGILLIWVLFIWFPNLVLKIKPDLLENEYYSMSYQAASALFTALAFGMTYLALRQQQKDTSRNSALDIFTNIFYQIQNDTEFINSKNYILYNLKDDIKKLKEQKYQEIGFGELLILENLGKKNNNENNNFPYSTIQYFCNKMEYLGVLCKKGYIDDIIFDYFGKTIIQTYEILRNILDVSRKRNDDSFFVHFRFLYEKAIERKENFMNECFLLNQEFDKNKIPKKITTKKILFWKIKISRK